MEVPDLSQIDDEEVLTLVLLDSTHPRVIHLHKPNLLKFHLCFPPVSAKSASLEAYMHADGLVEGYFQTY